MKKRKKQLILNVRLFLLVFVIINAAAIELFSQTCVGIGGSNPPTYTQSFDGLGNSPAPQNSDTNNIINLSSVAPAVARRYLGKFDNAVADNGGTVNVPGWAVVEEGASTSAVTGRYYVSDGSLANGNTGSFGTAGAADRALGSLNETTVIELNFIGGCFVNTASGTFTAVQINYTGEAWRVGGAGAADRLDFQYAVDTTPTAADNIYTANGGAFTDFNTLDFVTPATAGTTAGARDGNQAANRTVFAPTVVTVTLAPGNRLYVRWVDNDLASEDDDALAIDNFTIRFLPTAAGIAIGGRVLTAGGRSVAGARITLTGSDGSSRVILTNPFGYYRLDGLTAGSTYIVSAQSKRYRFAVPSQIITANENLNELNFTALP